MSGQSEHYAQCGCFCGCNEMCGPSMVPLRGHVECQRCFDGECVNEHYEKERREEITRRANARAQELLEILDVRGFAQMFKVGPF
jgi:hypothetical protein